MILRSVHIATNAIAAGSFGGSLFIRVFTTRKRSLGQGNIFTPVCHSVHRGDGGGGIPACIAGGIPACLAAGGCVLFQHALQVVSEHATAPGNRPPPRSRPPWEQAPPCCKACWASTPPPSCCKAYWDTTCNACWDSTPHSAGLLQGGSAPGGCLAETPPDSYCYRTCPRLIHAWMIFPLSLFHLIEPECLNCEEGWLYVFTWPPASTIGTKKSQLTS